MTIPSEAAKKCFSENLSFVDPAKEPEKFNLYNGLLNLADAIFAIEMQLRSIEHRVQSIKVR